MEKLAGSVFGDYKLLEYVTKGSYGYIYKIIKTSDIPGTPSSSPTKQGVYAGKIINFKNATDRHREVISREIDLLKKLETFKNENIVTYIDHVIVNDMVCIVMEYCDGSTLYEYIREMQSKHEVMRESEFLDILRQISLGVKFLHENNFMHRDLKTRNILMTRDKKIKICDFGVARLIDVQRMISHPLSKDVGTPYYMSPEILEQKPYDQKTDIWSLGCTCYEMATGQYAFEEETMTQIKKIVCNSKIPDVGKIKYTEGIKTLITQMLAKDSSSRPTIYQILAFIQEHQENRQIKEEDVFTDPLITQRSESTCGSETDPVTIDKNRRFLERQSAKLQKTIVKEIGGHKAPDILVAAKSLLKKKTESSVFKSKMVTMIGEDKYDRLYPLLMAMSCLENGVRALTPIEDFSPSLSGMEISLPGSDRPFKT